jgi:hypothetical protein
MSQGKDYKALLSEKQFLKVAQRAALLHKGTKLNAVLFADRELLFKTISGTDGHTEYTQRIEITDIKDFNVTRDPRTVDRMIRQSKLKCSCTCPAWHYYYKYISYKGGWGLDKELRPPVKRNPGHQGYVCKHLYLVASVYPFIANRVQRKFSENAEKLQKIQQRYANMKNAKLTKEQAANLTSNLGQQLEQNRGNLEVMKQKVENIKKLLGK